MGEIKKRWNINKDDLDTVCVKKLVPRYDAAKAQMQQRTYHHELYGLLAKNKSLHEWRFVPSKRKKQQYFSEGSTQYIMRKVLADTIQRVPDGELETQYDKATKEHIFLQFLFDNKIIVSEFEGIDMMSNLTNAFKMSFIYGFAPVRTGFELDTDGDVRVGFNLEQWSDVFINPDCRDIRRPEVVYFRQYLTKDDVLGLIDEDGNILDSTYNEKTVRYVIENDEFKSRDYGSEKMGDQLKRSTSIQSLMLITEYRRGAKEFVTFVPGINAEFRRVPNYDPRKGIPWNFLVLEPDPDFPLGVSQVEFLLADQQFNDLFQTSAYKNLLLAMEPPIMVTGWETNPSSFEYKPRKIWNMGNNPNNKVEPVKIDSTILNNWTTIREAVAASMLRNLNVSDGTVAKDAGVNYSKTAPGVEAQQAEKTININQYQKRVEEFFSQWAVQALRMYVAAMPGKHRLTVDEETRRKLYDIGAFDCIKENKVEINFSELSLDTLEFKVRAGSLIQRKEDQILEKLTVMIQPIIQNLNGWSEENRKVIENDVLLPATMRMLELSDTDIANTLADSLSSQIAKSMMADLQVQIDNNTAAIGSQDARIENLESQVQPQLQEQQAQGDQPVPASGEMPSLAQIPPMEGGETSPSLSASPLQQEKSPDEQVDLYEDLLSL